MTLLVTNAALVVFFEFLVYPHELVEGRVSVVFGQGLLLDDLGLLGLTVAFKGLEQVAISSPDFTPQPDEPLIKELVSLPQLLLLLGVVLMVGIVVFLLEELLVSPEGDVILAQEVMRFFPLLLLQSFLKDFLQYCLRLDQAAYARLAKVIDRLSSLIVFFGLQGAFHKYRLFGWIRILPVSLSLSLLPDGHGALLRGIHRFLCLWGLLTL